MISPRSGRRRSLRRRGPGRPSKAATEDGYVTIWMLLWTPVLLVGLAAIVDYGAAIQARALASDVALGAARAGAAEVESVTGEGPRIDAPTAIASATGYVAEAAGRSPQRTGLTATYSAGPDAVTVTVTVSYDPWLFRNMPGSFTRTETAQMQVGR